MVTGKMKKCCKFVLKNIIIAIFTLLLGIGIVIFIGALHEKFPEHPLDFQDINKIVLEKPINSIEDGLPYALNCSHKWRQDAVLTELQIVSTGKEEIENATGKLNYRFEFAYINKTKLGGTMLISINTNSNSIEFVSTSHDGEDKTRKIKELKLNNLTESIKKTNNVAIKAIGKDNIFKYEQPFVRSYINLDFATFEVGALQNGLNIVKYRVKIDMKTYDVLKSE